MTDLSEPLTRRQVEVVRAIVAGHTSDKQIGFALGIKPETAKNHVAAIFDTLHLKSRAALVLWAMHRGRGYWDPGSRFRRIVASDHAHREGCGCSVCHVHRVVEPREARERARRLA